MFCERCLMAGDRGRSLDEEAVARILLIDDDKDVRETIGRSLSLAGHDLSCAEDCDEGLRRMRAESPDLVICDILIPDKDGIETIMEIRKSDTETAIIAISGGGRYISGEFVDDILKSAELFGANYTLRKPFRPKVLLDLVEKALPGDGPSDEPDADN